jgi:hypothetical protein
MRRNQILLQVAAILLLVLLKTAKDNKRRYLHQLQLIAPDFRENGVAQPYMGTIHVVFDIRVLDLKLYSNYSSTHILSM